MRISRMLLSSAGLAAADTIVLARFMPNWSGLIGDLAEPHDWMARAGVDTAAIALTSALLWLAACWLAVGLLATAAEALPGRVGRFAAAISNHAMPAALRRLVIGAAGMSLLLSPASALAGTPATSDAATSAASAAAVGWPTDASPDAHPSPLPTIGWPSSTPVPTMDPSATPPASARTSPPAAAPKPAYTAPTIPSHQQPAVTVQPGDSLWLIAAHRLGPAASTADIAAEWPRWYGANQAQIGPDPGELVPGQQLTVPASTPEVH